jgi:hypothetical protein
MIMLAIQPTNPPTISQTMKLIMEVVLSQVDYGKPATHTTRQEGLALSGKWHAAQSEKA